MQEEWKDIEMVDPDKIYIAILLLLLEIDL